MNRWLFLAAWCKKQILNCACAIETFRMAIQNFNQYWLAIILSLLYIFSVHTRLLALSLSDPTSVCSIDQYNPQTNYWHHAISMVLRTPILFSSLTRQWQAVITSRSLWCLRDHRIGCIEPSIRVVFLVVDRFLTLLASAIMPDYVLSQPVW